FSGQREADTIWFIESGNHQFLNFRQACSIESAALHNPELPIRLLTTRALSPDCEYTRILKTLPNFRAELLEISGTFHSTPMESWYRSNAWIRSKHRTEHVSDALRYAILWRHGGIYMDLDVIMLRPLNGLTNSVVMMNRNRPNNNIMIFDKGHRFVTAIMDNCVKGYDPSDYNTCGPGLLQRMYEDGGSLATDMTFLGTNTFLAIDIERSGWFFDTERTASVFEDVRESYGVHIYNSQTKNRTFEIGSGCAYELLAIWNCPQVYKALSSK
ncbi:unnamed protein product, partial [Ixodes hexagonus]